MNHQHVAARVAGLRACVMGVRPDTEALLLSFSTPSLVSFCAGAHSPRYLNEREPDHPHAPPHPTHHSTASYNPHAPGTHASYPGLPDYIPERLAHAALDWHAHRGAYDARSGGPGTETSGSGHAGLAGVMVAAGGSGYGGAAARGGGTAARYEEPLTSPGRQHTSWSPIPTQ